jgi:hypothetical protein
VPQPSMNVFIRLSGLFGRSFFAFAVIAIFSHAFATKNLFAREPQDFPPNGTIPGNLTLLSTFQAISVKAPFAQDANGDNSAVIQFRPTGTTDWLTAGPLFIDRRTTLGGVINPYANQARGSIVGLQANTSYDVQVVWSDPDGVAAQAPVAAISTLSYTPPAGGNTITVTDDSTLAAALAVVNPGDTIHMNPAAYSPFTITRSGNSAAWITIEGDPGGGTIVGGSGVYQNVLVNASFVIIQNLTLSASDWVGILINRRMNSVFVRNNTLQNVSSQCASNPGAHYGDAGVLLGSYTNNIFVVNNSINSTSLSSASCTLSPVSNSPGAGVEWTASTTVVIQGNTVSGGFRDAITSDNAGNTSENIDIVGNTLSGYKDDGPESKGSNVNVRIWANRITGDQAGSCIATNTTKTSNAIGPVYIFRNSCLVTSSSPGGTTVFKLGGSPTFLFHNSVDASFAPLRWDAYVGVGSDTFALNNAVKTRGNGVSLGGTGSTFDYNIYVTAPTFARLWNNLYYYSLANFRAATGQELNGKQQDPLYLNQQLCIDSSSPAFDAGTIIPNFNDAASSWPYQGAAPDIGFYEYSPLIPCP